MRKLSFVAGGVLTASLLTARAVTGGDIVPRSLADRATAAGVGGQADGRADPGRSGALERTGVNPGRSKTPSRIGRLQVGPTFNAPGGRRAQQNAIASRIGRMIAGAPAGAMINVAMYHFASMDTATQLIAAKRRGVAVRVVLDHESTRYAAFRGLRRGLGGDTGKRSWVVVCAEGRGCVGPAFNHNKFFLFTTTLGARNVVVQTSANATYVARDTQWNDALTIADDQVYAGYLGYFHDLVARRPKPDYHRTVRAGMYRIDFFPWSSGDPISQALDKVSCAGGTRLRISVGHFTWWPIARRLWRLDDAGCRVQVVFDLAGGKAVRALTAPGGRHGNPEIAHLSGNTSIYVHSKYLLIDGGYEGRREKVVFTGSNNYTMLGFHGHDEAMITVADASIEDRYAAGFDRLFAHAHDVKPTAASVPETAIEPDDPGLTRPDE